MSAEAPNYSAIRDRARRAMKRFEKAVRRHTMVDTMGPSEAEVVIKEFERAKRELANYLQYIP